jgi:enterochelin esterase-like enzyme
LIRRFTGSEQPKLPAGEPIESAFTKDLVTHVDTTYPTNPERNSRIVAGYSMGGYGALRYSLAHPELFGAAIVLSPAVYFPLPPPDSSTREFGAFGNGTLVFRPGDLHG